MKVGFIGLGQMGRGMAARLLDAGHELSVYNRSAAAAETLRARGARLAREPVEALDAEVVITMLADDAAVEAVWITPGLIGKLAPSVIREQHLGAIAHGFGEKDWAALAAYIARRAGL